MPHIIVIGGGLIGLSTAHSLHLKGAKVTVVERDEALMHGTSYANSGMIHLSQASPWASVIGRENLDPRAARSVLSLAKGSAPLIAKNAAAFDLPMARRAKGCMQIFASVRDWQAAQIQYDALGIDYRRQPAGGLLGDRPALIFPDDQSGDARGYGRKLADSLIKDGVTIRLNTTAQINLIDGQAKSVRLNGEAMEADHIVLAAGHASLGLAAQVGLSLPLISIAGFALDFVKPDGLNLPDIPVMDAKTRSCLTIFGNRLRLSGTVGEADADALCRIWATLIPDLAGHLSTPISLPWRGERPACRLGRPLIGRSAVPRLWVNTGHAHMGWTLCAGSGALMADMIMDGNSDDRFSVMMP